MPLSHTAALVLGSIAAGDGYGFSVMELTGLPSGTVYPALRRLEDAGLVGSKWERPSIAQAEQRPPRKYYEVTKTGQAALKEARQRFRLLAQLEPLATGKPAPQKG
jgi:DNA-binding PadR family transcriptional regulator